jgi:hypothetical protein
MIPYSYRHFQRYFKQSAISLIFNFCKLGRGEDTGELSVSIYYIDKNAFRLTTGVSLSSEEGGRFIVIAKRSLVVMKNELDNINTVVGAIIHKLKGIVSSCGIVNAEIVCERLECYLCILNHLKLYKILHDLINNIIEVLDGILGVNNVV